MKCSSVSKISKKKQKELNSKQRNTWNFKPVTRVVPSGKIYSRKNKSKEGYCD